MSSDLRPAIEQTLLSAGAKPGDWLYRDDILQVSLRIFERTFDITAAINTLTLSVAGIALLASLLAIHLRRLPEYAHWRAMGLQRHEWLLIILLPLGISVLITWALSIPLGALLAWILIHDLNVLSFGWTMPMLLQYWPGLRLALLTLKLDKNDTRAKFCRMCEKERPSTREAVDWIRFNIQDGREPFRRLVDAIFNTDACKRCKHRGRRDPSLFEDPSISDDADVDYCWNKQCYGDKTAQAWQEQLDAARKKHGLIKNKQKLVKILGDGEIKNPITIQTHAISQKAAEKIKSSGGKVELINEVRPSAQPGTTEQTNGGVDA